MAALRWVGLGSLLFAASLAAQGAPARMAASAPRDTAVIQLPRYRFRLLGVYDEDTGQPVDSVEVSDVLTGTSALTSKDGLVSLFYLPDGGSLVRLRKIGYAAQSFMVPIAPEQTAPLTVTMSRATELPTVNIVDSAPRYLSPRLRAVEQRMLSGNGGYFVSEADMRKSENTTMANAFTARLPGLTRSLGPHLEEYLVSTRTTCGGLAMLGCRQMTCYVAVYIDGVPFDQAGGPIDFSKWSTFNFAMAEYYPGGASVPAQYNGTKGASCGVLLLWTRER